MGDSPAQYAKGAHMTPETKARQQIDQKLAQAGWFIQKAREFL
jgi:type I site-specific restriction endonuclease